MKIFGRALGRLAPSSLLRLYMVVVLISAATAIGVVLTSSSFIERESSRSSGDAHAALVSSQTRNLIEQQITTLATQRGKFLLSPAYNGLSPDVQAIVAKELGRDYLTDSGPADPKLPTLDTSLSQRESAMLQSSSDRVIRSISEVTQSSKHVNAERLLNARTLYKAAFDAFYASPNLAMQRNLIVYTQNLLRELTTASADASTGFQEDQTALAKAARFSRIAMICGLIFLTATMAGATLGVGRMIRQAFSGAEAEKETLRATTATLQYRNNQLNALYSVFSEITDTLSLPYVVAATLRETVRLMSADAAVLRLLKDDKLVFAGGLRDGDEMEPLPTIALGEEVTGRVAKRGRSQRVDDSRQDMLSDMQRQRGIHSGLIVPLIVGARVVGTLACWSQRQAAFNDQDERIMEMMASQVATAVAAADSTETSERRAHQDPLTGLPNRLQLNEDIDGELAGLVKSDGRAIIAMIDIDHFKHFNDDFGHRVGDVTLQKIASLLRNAVRDKDLVYRYGGEEFVMIFKDAGVEEGKMLAERVRTSVASAPMTGDRLEPIGPVTISIGLSVLPDQGADLSHLIELADAALYQAKNTGRNRVVVWTDPAAGAQHDAATHAAA